MRRLLIGIILFASGLLAQGSSHNATAIWARPIDSNSPTNGYALCWNNGTGLWTFCAISAGGVTSIATTSPVSGGTITTTGTISCPTCVSATSPGVGIAHFAGSTQAVTSSAINLAGGSNEVTGTLPNANLVGTGATTVNGQTCTLGSTCSISVGSVTSIATTSPITGGTITGTGTIACATCVTSAASLTNTAFMTGGGSQASKTPSATSTLDASGNASFAGTLAATGHTTFEGITSTGATGTGKLVYDTNPTLSGPALGTPASGVATNITGLPLTSGVTGVLPIANGGSNTSSTLTGIVRGGSSYTAAELSGDCTTSGSNVVTCRHVIGFTIDGAGAVIGTGDIKFYPTVAFACTISRIDISADQSGSITVDVWKAAGAIPTSGNKISASAPLTLSSAQLAQNGSRTGWTTSVSSGDVFGFSVATVATVTKVAGQIWCN